MRVLRLLKWVGIAAAGLAALAAATAYVLTIRSLPDYGETYRLEGVGAEIEIVRDSRAVPHIFAKSDADVYFALGFAHAQDRLWQMELSRRIAQGRLSELGARWLPQRLRAEQSADAAEQALLRIDEMARALDIDGAAKKSLEALSPEARRALEAYAAGVNAWIAKVNDGALGAGAPELLFLGATVEPWRPEDSVSVVKLLGAVMSSSVLNELNRGRARLTLGFERAEDLFPTGESAGDRRAAIIPGQSSTPPAEPNTALAALTWKLGFPLSPYAAQFGGASHLWAVSGERSGTRAPLLAVDPHLPLTTPGLWYVARLGFPGGAVIGATIPGAPVVLVGRNETIAWGFASLAADTGDFYIEKLDPADGGRYLTPQGAAEFEVRTEEIALSDGKAVEVRLLRTRNGPVLPPDWPLLASVTPKGHVASLRWTVLAEDDTTIEGGLRLMRASSVDDAIKTRPYFIAPMQLIAVADRRSIASMAVGRAPLRKAESRSRGRVPGAGWIAENDWIGTIPAEEAPLIRDPQNGAIAYANNRVGSGVFPRHLGDDWPAAYRLDRLAALLNKRRLHSLSAFQAMQSDEASEMARKVLPLMARRLWRNLEAESGARAAALKRLRLWYGDGDEVRMDALQAEPLIFTAWTRALTRRLIIDQFDGRIEGFEAPRGAFLERVLSDQNGAAARWCDDTRTPAQESCADMASLALDDALAELTAAYGDNLANWRWGRAHEAAHHHLAFGDGIVGSLLFTIRHEIGGGAHTLKRTAFLGVGDAPYQTVNAGGFRAVFDFANLDRSVYSISTGQSGHVLSRHYDDFSPLWRSGRYASLSLSRREAEAAAVGTTRLLPLE